MVRLTRGEPLDVPLTEVPGDPAAGPVTDHEAPLGREVRYVALPLEPAPQAPDTTAGAPPDTGCLLYTDRPWAGGLLVSRVVLVAPEAEGVVVGDGRGRVEGCWVRPARAAGVVVTLTGAGGHDVPLPEVRPEATGVRATGLGVGAYTLRVRCRYLRVGGGEVLSPGVEVPVSVHPWPEPVVGLGAHARAGGGVQLRWSGGAGADVRFVQWPGDGPAEGAELAAGELPPPLPWVDADGVAHPPPGTLATVRAVAVLGERALAGPGAPVEAPEPVARLTAHRTTPGRARISFDWPDHAGLVTVAAEARGERTEHPVVRAVFLREGLELPVGPGAVRITAYAAPRSAHATVAAPADAGQVLLPADVAIAYRVVPGPRRMLRRGPAVLRVTLVAPGGDPGAGLPDFVLVAGAGDGAARPHRPADGAELCRITGGELAAAGTVEREIAPRPTGGPYAVRGFLLGGRAASVRLDEPSLTSLVVR